MDFEDARASDLTALVELEQLCSLHPWTASMVTDTLSGTGGERVIVCTEGPGRELLGFCVYRVAAGEVEIHNIAVHPARRRQGLGRSLLLRAVEQAASAGATVAHLEVRAGNASAIALYRRAGFTLAGRRKDYYASPREDALLFSAPVHGPERPGHDAI